MTSQTDYYIKRVFGLGPIVTSHLKANGTTILKKIEDYFFQTLQIHVF